jgi:hypothetical protein
MNIVFSEHCQAYTDLGFHVKIANSLSEITNKSIVYIANYNYLSEETMQLLHNQAPYAIYLVFYTHSEIPIPSHSPLHHLIYMYENKLYINKIPADVLKGLLSIMNSPNSVPFLLRIPESPDKIGYPKQIERHYCYMGWNYHIDKDLVPEEGIYCGFYYGMFDHKKFLPLEERRKIYLSSIFALGIQSPENIRDGHVSQRIYEGLGYGCIVLTNSMAASLQTGGIAEYVETRKDVIEKIKYYMDNPEKRSEKQQAGYDFVKRQGTNHHAVRLITDKIEKLYGIDVFSKFF